MLWGTVYDSQILPLSLLNRNWRACWIASKSSKDLLQDSRPLVVPNNFTTCWLPWFVALLVAAKSQDSEECKASKLCNDSRHTWLPQDHWQVQPDRCLGRRTVAESCCSCWHEIDSQIPRESNEWELPSDSYIVFALSTGLASGPRSGRLQPSALWRRSWYFPWIHWWQLVWFTEGSRMARWAGWVYAIHKVWARLKRFSLCRFCTDTKNCQALAFQPQLWPVSGYNILILPTTGRFFQAACTDHVVTWTLWPDLWLFSSWSVAQSKLKCPWLTPGAIPLLAAKQRRRLFAGGRPCHSASHRGLLPTVSQGVTAQLFGSNKCSEKNTIMQNAPDIRLS